MYSITCNNKACVVEYTCKYITKQQEITSAIYMKSTYFNLY